LDLAGRPVDQRVLANMEALSQSNVPFGVNLVLGTHNHGHLPAIHDKLAALGARWLSVIPMFHGSAPDSTPQFMLSPLEIDSALARLYDHWVAQGRPLEVSPFTRCLRALDAGVPLSSLPAPMAFTVHPDGSITDGTANTSPTDGFQSRLLDYIRSCPPDDSTVWTELEAAEPQPLC
jgi:sulfatase maturation enzyme AslB (radical SAM superfamily)